MKKLSLLLATILVFAMTLTSFGAEFPDVSSDHWAYDAINELVAAGVVEGFPDGTFRPDEEFTREQMAVVVSRVLATINEDVDSINEDVNTLQDEVDALSGGLTTEQAQDVESLVKVLMDENGSDEEPAGITEEEATEMIEELTQEFAVDVMNLESDLAAHIERTEIQFEYLEEQIDEKLADIADDVEANKEAIADNEEAIQDNETEIKAQKNLNAMNFSDMSDEVSAVEEDVEDVDDRVTDLEDTAVSFSGTYDVEFTHQNASENADVSGVDYYYVEYDVGYYDINNDEYVEYFSDDYTQDDFIEDVEEYFETNEAEEGVTGTITNPDGEDISFEVVAEDEDPYVYTDPWDDDSDEIATDESNEITQTLTLGIDIEKDGFTSVIEVDVEEEEEEFVLDSAELVLENDTLIGAYNSENEVEVTDYMFNDTEFNGATVDFKESGISTFAGIKEYETGDEVYSEETRTETFGNNGYTDPEDWERDYVTFDITDDDEDGQDDLIADTEDEGEDYYVYGAGKTISMVGLDLNTVFAGRRKTDDSEVMTNLFGLNTSTNLAGFDTEFDLGFSMDKASEENDSLVRLGLDREMDLADVEFNYRNIGENFEYIDEDAVLTDDDEDDYDLFTTDSSAGVSGYNFTVKPNILGALDSSIFYGSVNDADDEDNTKLKLAGEYAVPFMDSLVVDASYTDEKLDDETDNTKTTVFGAEYTLLQNADLTFDYTSVNPVEDDIDDSDFPAAEENETTTEFGLDYSINDYISAFVDYENISNKSHLETLSVDSNGDYDPSGDEEDMASTTTGFGVDVEEYPVFGDLTASAGYSVENISGYGYTYDEYDEDDNELSLDELEEKTNAFNLGLGYTMGAAELDYDYINTSKEGEGVDDGTYATNEFGLIYSITDDTDFTADYEILDYSSDEDDVDDYDVKTATAGVSISF